VLLRAKRKAGGEERRLDAVVIGNAYAGVVTEGAGAPLRREEEVAQRLVDHAGDHLLAVAQADRDRPEREVLQVVRGAVERIDDPGTLAGAVGRGVHAGFLAEDAVSRGPLLEVGDDGRFALAIRPRHPVVARLQIRVFLAELFPIFQQHRGPQARRIFGNLNVLHEPSGGAF